MLAAPTMLAGCGDDLESRNAALAESQNAQLPQVETSEAPSPPPAPVVDAPGQGAVSDGEDTVIVDAQPDELLDSAQGFDPTPIDDGKGYDPSPDAGEAAD